MSEEKAALSKYMRVRLNEMGRTQAWLSEQLGMNRTTVSYYANGLMFPRSDSLGRILEVLQGPYASFDDLMADSGRDIRVLSLDERRKNLSDYIRQRLSEKGRNQAWLARQIGCGEDLISYYVGRSRYPKHENLERILNTLGCPLVELLQHSDDLLRYGQRGVVLSGKL
ncbi:helix-turn-helix transcriptional regulator [Candidatus Woesearchaeota archaeon]|nr:helix-turn-helix transcriptional regulator [Candidatus Woesearchaeota archaeon]